MSKKLWKVHVPLKLRYPGTKTFEIAEIGDIVEERAEAGISDGSGEVRVYRLHKDHNDFHSFMVPRSELDSSAKACS
jgi:hypothetical protein